MYLKHKIFFKDGSVTCLCLGFGTNLKNLLTLERNNDVFVTLFSQSHDAFSLLSKRDITRQYLLYITKNYISNNLLFKYIYIVA